MKTAHFIKNPLSVKYWNAKLQSSYRIEITCRINLYFITIQIKLLSITMLWGWVKLECNLIRYLFPTVNNILEENNTSIIVYNNKPELKCVLSMHIIKYNICWHKSLHNRGYLRQGSLIRGYQSQGSLILDLFYN